MRTFQFSIRSHATYDWFLPNSIHVASLRDAGKEGVSLPHTAEPNRKRGLLPLVVTPGSLYGVIEIQPLQGCWKISQIYHKSLEKIETLTNNNITDSLVFYYLSANYSETIGEFDPMFYLQRYQFFLKWLEKKVNSDQKLDFFTVFDRLVWLVISE